MTATFANGQGEPVSGAVSIANKATVVSFGTTDTSAAVQIVNVEGSGCKSAPVAVLRVGGGIATLEDGANGNIAITISQQKGVLGTLSATVSPDLSTATVAYDSSPDANAYHIDVSASVALPLNGGQAFKITADPKIQLMAGAVSVMSTTWSPGGAFSVSACDLLSQYSNTISKSKPWVVTLADNTAFSIYGLSSTCANGNVQSATLNAQITNGYLSKSPIDVSGTFASDDTSGATAAQLTMTDATLNLFQSGLQLQNLTFGIAAGTRPNLTLSGTLATPHGSLSSDSITLQFTSTGMSLQAGLSAVIKGPGYTATLQNLSCGYDVADAKLGFKACTGSVAVTLTALGGSVTAALDDSGISTTAQDLVLKMPNGYELDTIGLKLAVDQKHNILVTTERATLRNGMLGAGGVTILGFSIADGAVCGQVQPTAAVAAGPFTLSNLKATLTTITGACTPAGLAIAQPSPMPSVTTRAPAKAVPVPASTPAPVGLVVTTDAALTYPSSVASDPNINLHVTMSGIGLTIPFNGGVVTVTPPPSVSLSGSLFGRTIVGVCPAIISGTRSGGLPSATVGASTVSSADLSDPSQVFRILGDGRYAICAGVHVTPGTTTGTADLVNAQFVFEFGGSVAAASPKAVATGATTFIPTPRLDSARISFGGNGSAASITTKIGARSITMTSLDLSYDNDQDDWVEDQYIVDNNIPLLCKAALTGQVTMSIQGIAAVGNVSSTTTGDSTLNTTLGVGANCVYADVFGSVTIPVSSNSSVVLRELHFASGPRATVYPRTKMNVAAVPVSVTGAASKTAWYSKVNAEINVGQGGVAVHDAGLEDYDGVVRTSGGVNWNRTIGMNVGWVISGLTGFFAGLLSHGL